jgi:signal transduction histidine kinase/ActR/RegA family two-component response regulator
MANRQGVQPLSPSRTTSERPHAFPLAAGVYALLGSLVSFLGWPLDIPRLTDWLNDGISIQPNTAVLVMLSATGVILAQLRAWRAVATIGALVAVGGIVILAQYLVGADFGFNHQLLFGQTWGQETTVSPGRMGPPAATSLALIGTALLLLGYAGLQPARARIRRFVPAICIAVCVFMTFSLLGYLFDAEQFYSIPWLTAIALQTATMLFAVAMALIATVPEHDPMLLLRERTGAGTLARIAIPALALMIPLILWLRVRGQQAGYYDIGTGRALGAIALMAACMAVVWAALRALRQREQVLVEADHRKDVFLATLAHELRNPLAPLRNALELQRRAADDSRIIESTRAIMERQVVHMVRLVDDLLDMSRMTSGRLQLRKTRVELADVLNLAVETAKPLIDVAKHELTIAIPPQPIYVQADSTRLAQVFANLLHNSVKYTGPGGHIWLTAELRGQEALVTVRDTGIGITTGDLPRIFELFAQVAPVLERSKGGLGIGLALARGLIELHGGTIEATSAGLGKGSEFTVRLPVLAAVVDAADVASHEPPPRPVTRHRILIVDDLADAADSLAIMIQMMGQDTRTAYDGVEAVQAVGAFKPDVVFLDIGLPKMNGYDAARTIRAQPDGKHIVLVAVTGWGQEQDRLRAAEAGFDHHLTKPVDPQMIEALIAGLDRTINRDLAPSRL